MVKRLKILKWTSDGKLIFHWNDTFFVTQQYHVHNVISQCYFISHARLAERKTVTWFLFLRYTRRNVIGYMYLQSRTWWIYTIFLVAWPIAVLDFFKARYERHSSHDDVIKQKDFPRNWPFVRGIHRSPVNSPQQGQWRGTLVFSLNCAWRNSRENNRDAVYLRRHGAHYDVTVMDLRYLWKTLSIIHVFCVCFSDLAIVYLHNKIGLTFGY